MKIYKNKWEKSYERGENLIFYPNEQTIKFLNRFVRKRIGINRFKDVLDTSKTIRGLDYGCGIGGNVMLMKQFGIEAHGIDVSPNAIRIAKDFSSFYGYEDIAGNFLASNGNKIPFKDNFFDITISNAVLDSMSFKLAKKIMIEIERVTKKIVFLSLISGDDNKHSREYSEEEIVKTTHEEGTIQSYFNWEKIKELIKGTRFQIESANLTQDSSITSGNRSSRYYVVLRKIR